MLYLFFVAGQWVSAPRELGGAAGDGLDPHAGCHTTEWLHAGQQLHSAAVNMHHTANFFLHVSHGLAPGPLSISHIQIVLLELQENSQEVPACILLEATTHVQVIRGGHLKGKTVKHSCCVGGTW